MPYVWRDLDDWDALSPSDIPMDERERYWSKVLKLRTSWLETAHKACFEAQEQLRLINKEIAWTKDNKLFPEQQLRRQAAPQEEVDNEPPSH